MSDSDTTTTCACACACTCTSSTTSFSITRSYYGWLSRPSAHRLFTFAFLTNRRPFTEPVLVSITLSPTITTPYLLQGVRQYHSSLLVHYAPSMLTKADTLRRLCVRIHRRPKTQETLCNLQVRLENQLFPRRDAGRLAARARRVQGSTSGGRVSLRGVFLRIPIIGGNERNSRLLCHLDAGFREWDGTLSRPSGSALDSSACSLISFRRELILCCVQEKMRYTADKMTLKRGIGFDSTSMDVRAVDPEDLEVENMKHKAGS